MTKWILVLVCVWSTSLLAGVWTLTTADFQQRDGTLEQISAAGVTLKDAAASEVPWQDVVALEHRAVVSVKTSDAFVLYTRNGQRLAGEPESVSEDKLTWKSSMLSSVLVPLDEISSIARAGVAVPPAADKEDRVVLQNGDVLTGVIEQGDGGIVLQKGAANTPVAWEAIRSMSLAQIGDKAQPAAGLRVRLADGSVCLAKSIRVNGDQMWITQSSGVQMQLPMERVQAIANEQGRVRFLAWMEPTKQEYAPYASFTATPRAGVKRLDEVTVDGRAYRNVVQIRPTSTVSYRAPVTGQLHVRFACGNAGRYTDMSLRIVVAGKVVHEAASVKSPQAGPAVDLPVKAGDEVRFEVGLGANYDVQDFLWLLDAAFVGQAGQ